MAPATIVPKTTTSAPRRTTDLSMHSRWALHSAISGGATERAGSSDRPERAIRSAPWLVGMAQIRSASASGGKFTTNCPAARALRAVAWDPVAAEGEHRPPEGHHGDKTPRRDVGLACRVHGRDQHDRAGQHRRVPAPLVHREGNLDSIRRPRAGLPAALSWVHRIAQPALFPRARLRVVGPGPGVQRSRGGRAGRPACGVIRPTYRRPGLPLIRIGGLVGGRQLTRVPQWLFAAVEDAMEPVDLLGPLGPLLEPAYQHTNTDLPISHSVSTL